MADDAQRIDQLEGRMQAVESEIGKHRTLLEGVTRNNELTERMWKGYQESEETWQQIRDTFQSVKRGLDFFAWVYDKLVGFFEKVVRLAKPVFWTALMGFALFAWFKTGSVEFLKELMK